MPFLPTASSGASWHHFVMIRSKGSSPSIERSVEEPQATKQIPGLMESPFSTRMLRPFVESGGRTESHEHLAQPTPLIDIIANNNIDQKVVEISSLQHYALVENSIDHSIFLLKAYTMMFS